MPGLDGPAQAPAPVKPRRLAFLETAGWRGASAEAKAALAGCVAALEGGRRRDRHRGTTIAKVAAVETAIAEAAPAVDADQRLGIALAAQHAAASATPASSASVCSTALRGGEAMTLDDYRARSDGARRASARVYAELAAHCDGLRHAWRRPAPRRSAWRRPAIRNSPCRARCSACPAISLPLLSVDGTAARPAGHRIRRRGRRGLRASRRGCATSTLA